MTNNTSSNSGKLELGRNGSKSLPPEGPVAACLDSIDDIFKQPGFDGGEAKYKHVYRYHIEECIKEGRLAGQVYRISDIISDSLHEKSKLRKVIKALRGYDLTPDEIRSANIDFGSILKKTCLVTISHKMAKGSLRACIDGYAQLPHGMKPLTWMPEKEVPEWVRQMQAARLDKPVDVVILPTQ